MDFGPECQVDRGQTFYFLESADTNCSWQSLLQQVIDMLFGVILFWQTYSVDKGNPVGTPPKQLCFGRWHLFWIFSSMTSALLAHDEEL